MKKIVLSLACTVVISLNQNIKAQLSFDSPVNYSVGNPWTVITDDFNGDGKADLVTTNQNASNNISVLLGSGTGTFATRVNYGVGGNPISVTSADFNGDGNIDLATANDNSNNVSILMGNGAGAFVAPVNYGVGAFPQFITSADFNGDGNVDLVTANYNSNNVSILLSSGTGSFAPAVNYGVVSMPFSITSADFNGDGNVDLVVAPQGGSSLSLLLGSGTGTFAAAVNFGVAGGPISVTSADFNGDGNADLATANLNSNDVSILLGSGTGTFALNGNYGIGTLGRFVACTDLNGDGEIDLYTANYNTNDVSVLLGTGTGIFASAVNFGSDNGPITACSADFNGDGKADLATANYGGPNNVSVLLNSSIPPAEALNFDGVDDYVSTIINCDNTVMPDMTWEAWVKPTNQGNSNWQMILSAEDGGWDRFLATQNGLFSMGVGSGPFQPVAPDWNQWQHIAIVYSGTQLTFYKNGVPYVYTGVVDTLTQNSMLAPFMLGNVSHFGFPYTGNIDEVRVWNVARTQCEINTYMNCEIPNTITGLIANYHFNQGFNAAVNTTVTTLTDASGNINTGSLTGFALTTGSVSNWVAPGGVLTGYTITLAPLNVSSTVTNSVICNGQQTTFSGAGAVTYTWTNGVLNATPFSPTVTTIYTVTGTNTLTGCYNSSVNSVTVNAIPTISVASGVVCSGASFTMTPGGASTYTYSSGAAIVTPTADATYSVSGTDANGCVSSIDATSSITVNALPNLIATTNNTLLCTGETAMLSVTGATSYTWSTTETTMDIIVNPTSTAIFTVNGTDGSGCMNTTIIQQDVSLCTRVLTLSASKTGINIYPNPVKGLFYIELLTTSRVSVTNALGQVILTETLNAGKHEVVIQNQSAGVYFVKVMENNKQQVIKLIKE